MKIYYCGVSSRYIHTMPAGWFFAEYLRQHDIRLNELYYNINEPYHAVLETILGYDIDMILFSIYIFNVDFVKRLILDIRAIRPSIIIVIGGPEADIHMDYDHIILGEGEQALADLIINGGGKIIKEQLIDNLNEIPSPYTQERIAQSGNRLIYYESSRGCPFSCSYCMASLSCGVRYFSLDRVKEDLSNLVKWGCKIVKFTDRTFNANDKRAKEIISFIKENFSDTNTCFHFEVGGELFSKDTLDLLCSLPNGLVQLEAGVQTINPRSLQAINRVFDIDKFQDNITRIRSSNNIHMHLDLIAGLPYDTIQTFKESFDKVIDLRPHMLQLGFLKFLKGTAIMDNYTADYDPEPPYEVISTPYMTREEFKRLKRIEWVLDRLYNSGKFRYTLDYLMRREESAFELFDRIGIYYEKSGLNRSSQEHDLFNHLYIQYQDTPIIKDLLKLDYVTTNNSRKIPKLLKERYSKEFLSYRALYKNTKDRYLAELNYLPNNGRGHFIIMVDYSVKHPVDNSYRWEIRETAVKMIR